MEFKTEFAGHYFLITTTGEATVEDFDRLINEMLGRAEWKIGMSWITDHSDLDTGPLTVSDVKMIADLCAQNRERFGAGKIAVVLRRDLEFGLARMWAVFVEGRWDVEAGVFRSLDDAIDWLSAP